MLDKEIVALFQRWQWRPDLFVKDVVFRNAPPDKKPSTQQIHGLKLVGQIARAKTKRALIEKLDHSLGKAMTKEEAALAKKKGISVRSGHGTGKDAFLSWVFFWLLCIFPKCRGQVTANNATQLQTVLWSEFRKWIRFTKENSPTGSSLLSEKLEVLRDEVFCTEEKGIAFVKGRAADVKASLEEQGEALAGAHADYMIMAVDEASAIPPGVFRPIEGAMTGVCNFAILIGNGTRSSGYFYDTHNSDRARWACLHWDSEKSEITNKHEIEADKEKYGEDSNWFRTRRRGEFPIADDDTLIPLEKVEDAVGRAVTPDPKMPLVMGIDVAREGADKSVILVRQGYKVLSVKEINTKDTMVLAGWARMAYLEAVDDGQAVICCVDTIGVGGPVYDRLRELKVPVRPVSVSNRSSNPSRFTRLRDELWWKVREMFMDNLISIPKDDALMAELSNIKYTVNDSTGQLKIESKKSLKSRSLHSPDRADALCLTFAVNDRHYTMERPRYQGQQEEELSTSWMAA